MVYFIWVYYFDYYILCYLKLVIYGNVILLLFRGGKDVRD